MTTYSQTQQTSLNSSNSHNQRQSTQMNQTSIQPQYEVPTQPLSPPSFQGDSTFWTIMVIAILAKVIVGYPTEPRK